MFKLVIPEKECYDEKTGRFISSSGYQLDLEHSLISVSKWESKWKKPFLSETKKTVEESIDYIRCMTISRNIPDEAYYAIDDQMIEEVNRYIADPMTATTVNEKGKGHSRQVITSELIYYWMIALEIPFECEKWHLNRLLMLIKVTNAKNNPGKKMGFKDVAKQNSALNRQRMAARKATG